MDPNMSPAIDDDSGKRLWRYSGNYTFFQAHTHANFFVCMCACAFSA